MASSLVCDCGCVLWLVWSCVRIRVIKVVVWCLCASCFTYFSFSIVCSVFANVNQTLNMQDSLSTVCIFWLYWCLSICAYHIGGVNVHVNRCVCLCLQLKQKKDIASQRKKNEIKKSRDGHSERGIKRQRERQWQQIKERYQKVRKEIERMETEMREREWESEREKDKEIEREREIEVETDREKERKRTKINR